MKRLSKLGLSLLLSGMVLTGYSQTNNRVSAYNALKDYGKLMKDNPTAARGKLLEAKEYIDQAAEHPDTQNDPKTLFYKGQIYMSVAQFAAMKADGFAQFDPEKSMTGAFDAFKASIANKNKKDDFTDQIRLTLAPAHQMAYKTGIEMYNRASYDSAQSMFESCVLLMDVVGMLDTNAAFNAGLCAEYQIEPTLKKCQEKGDSVCADTKELYEAALRNYKKALESGYQGADMVVRYADVAQRSGDLDLAKATLEAGKAKYPNSNAIVIQEFNFYLMTNNNAAAEKALATAIQNNPKDPILYFNAGAIYSDLKKYDEAEKAYKKAIEIEPKYFDAYYNLGAMYYNQAADMYAVIQDIKDNALYEKEKAKADQLFKDALPFLEKGRTLNPNDKNNLVMLRTIYARLNMTDKWKEVNDIIKNG